MECLLWILLERGLKMEIRSYDIMYLDSASENIGTIFEYAVDCGYEPILFWNMFVSSDVARQIENGNPRYLVGYSAIDLFNIIIKPTYSDDYIIPNSFINRNKFYWAGWTLAQYQNYKSMSFFNINKILNIEKVLSLYDTLHEADITKFFEIADEYINNSKKEINLRRIRISAGLSQKQLADKAKVSIRSIQMYEQRNNDINKAQVDILFRLSKTLGCKIEDLFE